MHMQREQNGVDHSSSTPTHETGDEETASDRLRETFELFEFGVEMMAANLRRKHPDATLQQIEQLLEDWLATRPGAEAGDAPGDPVPASRWR